MPKDNKVMMEFDDSCLYSSQFLSEKSSDAETLMKEVNTKQWFDGKLCKKIIKMTRSMEKSIRKGNNADRCFAEQHPCTW